MLLIINGVSGSGKTTFINSFKNKEGYQIIPSITTRKKRAGEKEGEDYYFTSISHFERMIQNDELVDYSLFLNNYYGLTKENIKKALKENEIVIVNSNVSGMLRIKNYFSSIIKVVTIHLTADRNVLTDRLLLRGSKERLETLEEELSATTHTNYDITLDTSNGIDFEQFYLTLAATRNA